MHLAPCNISSVHSAHAGAAAWNTNRQSPALQFSSLTGSFATDAAMAFSLSGGFMALYWAHHKTQQNMKVLSAFASDYKRSAGNPDLRRAAIGKIYQPPGFGHPHHGAQFCSPVLQERPDRSGYLGLVHGIAVRAEKSVCLACRP